MNHLSLFLLIILIVNFRSSANVTSKEQLFYDAVRLESAGDIVNAIKNYENALSQASSANLHGNLANLYYLNGDYGRSILHYRKALLLEPNNRDFRYNLAYVNGIAKVAPPNIDSSIALIELSGDFWKSLLAIFFWSGLLIICFLYFRRFKNKFITMTSACWILGNILLFYVIYNSTQQTNILERTVVAVSPFNVLENNSSAVIQLRKFAAKTSSSNSSVRVGESLIVEKKETGGLQSHESQDAQTWLLVSTLDKRRKGWVLEEEIGWLSRN